MMTRAEVLRKSITVFEAIRRMASKGNAGLEPERGAEEEYSTVEECVRVMKEWLREMESGTARAAAEPDVPKVVELREWQRIAAEKPPERMDFDEDS